jgi:N-acetylmuramoyl-L-alanine amidase
MSFFQRVATVAAISLSLTGFGGVGTAGIAADFNRTTVTQPASLPIINTLTPATVPSAAPASVQAAPATAETPAPTADAESFASLSEAVAAQDHDASDDTLRCLATAIYFESKSEPMAGQLAVAQVIINRTKSGRFPANVCGVVKQRGQFSFVRGGALPVIDGARAQYRTALAVAKVALAKAWSSTAANALFFHARSVLPAGRHVVVASIGNHIFYR